MSRPIARSVILIAAALVLGALLAFAGSQGSWSIGPLPGFAIAVAAAFVVQWIAFVPAMARRTERFFDLTGSLTYIVVTVGLLLLAPSFDVRSVLLTAVVVIWAVRLGSFLFMRVRRSGADDRFDEIKTSPVRFLSVWTVQGAWVSLTAAAAWIAITSEHAVALGASTWIGLGIWALGFAIEVIADAQKSRFKADPANDGRFISTGLWSVVRHPNYLGEIVLWVGVLVITAPALRGWQWIAILSPLFVILLLTKVSGIPLLEEKAQRKWGDDPEYQAYRERTPALIPGRRGVADRSRARRVLGAVGAGVLSLVLVAVVGFVIWAEQTYQAEPQALAAVSQDDRVEVSQAGGPIVMTPTGEANGQGLVFFAGAKVVPEAYEATFRDTVAAGTTVVITQSLLNLPLFETRPLADFTGLAPEVTSWSVGGHSMGGVKACMYADADRDAVDGLVLLASYCSGDALAARDDLPVLSISGTNDGLATPEKIEASAAGLPADTEFVAIDGGVHAQFGAYGAQSGDGEPTISDDAARAQITEALEEFFAAR
ncbi:DUF1295 domain-containing protein [Leucobacter japonicus]|uniref:DUF1295 domain-containing protein n=1 Tax=Leucobacter japonicus TaxID=1461259 RepID=UPI00094989C2|nr:DUF1295 domain-containing protein [Leucobacter japonicus]